MLIRYFGQCVIFLKVDTFGQSVGAKVAFMKINNLSVSQMLQYQLKRRKASDYDVEPKLTRHIQVLGNLPPGFVLGCQVLGDPDLVAVVQHRMHLDQLNQLFV